MQKVNWRVSLPVFLAPAGFLSFITQVRQFAELCCLFSCNYLCGASPAAVFSHDSSCFCMIVFKRHSCRNPRRCRREIWGFQILSFFAPSVSPSLLPPSLPRVSSLDLTGDTLKCEIVPLLFPLSLHADGFFIIFRCSYEKVKIHILKSVCLPSLFTLICDVSLSYSTPHPYSLSLPLFILWHFSIPSLLFHHWFLHSLNVRPSIRLSPHHSHISLYCLVFLFYIFHPTSPPPRPPHPPLYQSSRGLPVYLGINLPLTQPLLNNFFCPFFTTAILLTSSLNN